MGKLLLWVVFFLVPACLIVKAMFRKPKKRGENNVYDMG